MKSRDFYTKVLASTSVFLFLILVLSTASASATAQSASTEGIYAYITNQGSGTVSVIDTENNTVTVTIPVGSGPNGVAVNPDGTKAYVTNSASNNVSVIDTANNTVTSTVDVGNDPAGVAVNPNGTRIYVTNSVSNNVSVIDTANNTVTATVVVGTNPRGVAVSPDGSRVYVTNYGSNTVSIIDTVTNTATVTVPAGNYPEGIAVNPDGTKVYVANSWNNTVSVIDTANNTVTATIDVGNAPCGVAVIPDGTKAYVANEKSNTISVIDTAKNTVKATVKVGKSPAGVAVTADGAKVYAANGGSNTVSVIDTTTNKVTTTVDVGCTPVAFGQFIERKPVPFSQWEFSPQEPVSGDLLNINGSASPGEKVDVFVTFEKTVPVSKGKFEYTLEGVKIPEGFNNLFTVEARGAKNLNVRAKMVLWVTKSSEASGDIATVSQSNVLPGTYKIKIDGNAGKGVSEVNLKITAFKKIKADSNGNFSYSYDTTAVPPGDFEVKVGDITKEITLRPEETEEPSLVLPVANFSSDVTEGYAPLTVQFTDLSENATSVSWDFGERKSSTERNPVHKFTTQGTYTVNLTAINGNGTDSKSAIINVTKKPIHWEFSPQEPVSGDILNINGSASPGEKVDVFVTFEKAVPVSKGKFEYTLEGVKIPEGFNNLFKVEAKGAKNLNVRVKMVLWVTKSSGASGDTATVSQSNVPSGTYTVKIDGNAGKEVSEVNLKITAFQKIKADSNGNFSYSYDTKSVPTGDFEVKVGDITKKIIIKPEETEQPSLVLPVANFSSNVSEGYAPLSVQFNNLSENATGVSWDFENDGVIDSIESNPVHEFIIPGNYTVNLTATNENGTASKLATINVSERPVIPVANFSTNASEGYAPFSVQFDNLSENADTVSWDFENDGVIDSIESNPVHEFTIPGNYTVNLTTTNENGTNSTFATIAVLQKPVPVSWGFTPQEPVSGDVLDISGSASPGEKVDVFVTFEKAAPVSKGKFEYVLEGVKIPEGFNNLFTVEAKGAKNLNVRAKTVLWVTKSSEASGDIATVSQSNVPPGTYTVKIDGNAGKEVSEVNLKITAFQKIKADSNGNFSYSYDTTAVPPGNFEVKVGDTTKEITLRPEETEEPSLVLPVADFSSDITEGYAPLTVQFTDLSENATSVIWDFGDRKNSTERNPVHKFTTQGTYTVNLTAINGNGTDPKSAIINVTKKPIHWAFSPQEPVSGDILNIDGSGSPGEKVDVFATFEKTVPVSRGKFEYNLEGVKIPEGFNNLFTVEANGAKKLNVRVKMVLWVTKSSEASGDTATVSQSNVPPGTYKIKINGDAGDGVSEVNLKITAFQKVKSDSNGNFSYSYDTKSVPPGDFEVKVGDVTKKITIKPEETEQPSLVLPVANFSINVSEGYAPLSVQFNNMSENADTISWDFENDGVIDSIESNPVHEFIIPGNYTVNLTATNENGTASKLATINVSEVPVIPVANFSTNVSEGYAPLTVQFTDLSENVTEWNWDFENDGVIDSIESNPIHEYTAPGNYTVNLTAANQNGTDSKLATINVVTSQVIPPQSISEIQSSPESTWINWTWINPDDSNFDHTEIYLNGTFQANTSAEYFNATDLQPETDYIIGTRTADIYGNVNETWVNASAKTKPLPDVDQPIDIDLPVIESVMLFPANTTGRSRMDISANITDNIGVVEVTAGDVQLMSIDGSWQGNITAPSSVGKYSLLIRAKDSAGNTVNTSVPYSVIRRQGSVDIEVLPAVSTVVAGKNTNLAIKIKNSQNIDDTFKVQISTNELPASYRTGIPWFRWTEKTVNLRAKQEVLIPIEVKVPSGTVTGLKLFRVNVNSEKFSVQGSDIGYLVISRPRYIYK